MISEAEKIKLWREVVNERWKAGRWQSFTKSTEIPEIPGIFEIDKKITSLEENLRYLDFQYRFVDCKFIQDHYMRRRSVIEDKILKLKMEKNDRISNTK